MKVFLILLFVPHALGLHAAIPCRYDPVPERLHNWRITCETYGIHNMEPASHYDHNIIHQHGACYEA